MEGNKSFLLTGTMFLGVEKSPAALNNDASIALAACSREIVDVIMNE